MKFLAAVLCGSFCVSFSALAGSALFYVGDSHSYLKALTAPAGQERLGNVVIAGLEAKGFDVTYYAACGASPGTWASGATTACGYTAFGGGKFTSEVSAPFPSVGKIYDRAKFSQLVVNLGDNMFTWSQNGGKLQASFDANKFQTQMRAFFAKTGEPQADSCTWIGPTYHVEGATYRKPNAAVDAMYAALKEFLAGKCRLIDSRPIVVTATPNDGLHHVQPDSKKWGEGILSRLGF